MRAVTYLLLVVVVVSFEFSAYPLSPTSLKKQAMKSKRGIKKASLNTVEKRIREFQDLFLQIEANLVVEQERLSVLTARNKDSFLPEGKGSDLERKKVLARLQLAIADSDSLEGLAEQSILLQEYNSILKKEGKLKKLSASELKKLDVIKKRIKRFSKVRKSILLELKEYQRQKIHLLAEIEESKIMIEEMSKNENREVALALRRRKNSLSKVKVRFVEPIIGYQKFDREDRGLSFECLDKCSINSPATGYVVYNGELAPYGKILMIAHAGGYKSVFLGDINFNVKTTEKVRQGSKIGSAAGKPFAKVYFELRKNSKVEDVLSHIPFY